ncbi:aminodeoxychorismate synthase component I [Macrococcus hajekii]|uniref:Aminodeoxychorismate synthase component I n=1 Tax=Macrococcus hajekii TaxID=198482 RepID=A0A4R6BIN3_9STAP|nr:aminodeoxychorismate synthase component I [Macrococcus hajekii]TDM01512.1 aminodeoxychorismate synthase component I [Macrococcus hajekii]GGB00586.1 aminodeoxychorismate synthase, component I [Macrococcus hajekii]
MRACIQFKEVGTLYFANPLEVLTAYTLEEVENVIHEAEKRSASCFVVGYLNYEAARAFSSLMKVKDSSCYAKFYVFNETVGPFAHVALDTPIKFAFTETKEKIENDIRYIQERIRQGDTYQVNYTTRLKAEADIDAYALYCKLTEMSNGDYCAFIEDEDHAIISISPELFFKYDKTSSVIQTKPMKGTLSRHVDPEVDEAHYLQLKASKKDQAENVMIVDLLRNDLSRIARKNSVHVPALFDIEKYPTVFQMTSTVEALIEPAYGLFDILKALFPCGSITGAPKISTMSIIDELETHRGIYCGTIGIMTPDIAVFNVPIRTIEKQGRKMVYGVGGGITIDSEAELEFEEMVMKTRILRQLASYQDFHLIETMRVDSEGIRRKNFHLRRLLNSLAQFDFIYNEDLLNHLFTKRGEGCYRLAVYDGYISAEERTLPETQLQQAVLLPMGKSEHIWRQHKTSHRQHYKTEEGYLALYYDGDQKIIEFNIGNVVYAYQGQLYTPATDLQLPGCMQAALLAQNKIARRELYVEELHEIESIWMINSLREWVPIEIQQQNMEKFCIKA